MRMQLDRNLDRTLQRLDQVIGLIGSEQSGHILDADGIRTRIFNALRVFHIIVRGKDRTGGIGNGNLRMAAFLFRRADGGL